jgi:hypothetical protein
MIRYTEHPEEDYVVLVVNGDTSGAELAEFMERLDRFAEGREASFLEIVERFGSTERGSFVKAMRFRLKNLRRLRRLAVVTDSRALGLLLRVVDLFSRAEIRRFPPRDEDLARRWVSRPSPRASHEPER